VKQQRRRPMKAATLRCGRGRVRLDLAHTGQCGMTPKRPKSRPIKICIALSDAPSYNI
jgi:hypothetical protein